jgi:hypothetical protein
LGILLKFFTNKNYIKISNFGKLGKILKLVGKLVKLSFLLIKIYNTFSNSGGLSKVTNLVG